MLDREMGRNKRCLAGLSRSRKDIEAWRERGVHAADEVPPAGARVNMIDAQSGRSRHFFHVLHVLLGMRVES
jgi:hypothetical protein